jgi:hypothetical protein
LSAVSPTPIGPNRSFRTDPSGTPSLLTAAAVLHRPDGYVATATTTLATVDTDLDRRGTRSDMRSVIW